MRKKPRLYGILIHHLEYLYICNQVMLRSKSLDILYFHDLTITPSASNSSIFCLPPLLGPLLFDNTDSDARDHCANERTFLSYLRLSIYMTIVSIAIVISFHLKSTPSPLELRFAKPLGLVFWGLSVMCLVLGVGNYITTVEGYGKRAAIVQTGWKTQSVSYLSSYRHYRRLGRESHCRVIYCAWNYTAVS